MAGFHVLSTRAHHTETQRTAAQREFNDPESPVQILVVSMSLSSAGLDLHGACHHGVFANLTFNKSTLFQAMGRLSRIGQKHAVQWTFVMPQGSHFKMLDIGSCDNNTNDTANITSHFYCYPDNSLTLFPQTFFPSKKCPCDDYGYNHQDKDRLQGLF